MPPRSLSLILTLLLVLAASVGRSEERVLPHPGWTGLRWSVEDGLPVNSINAMVRDADGFLWLATMDGLVRFDGFEFLVFDTRNAPGLAGNRLIVLRNDGENALWMTTEDTRLVRYHNGVFRTVGRDDGLPHHSVTALSTSPQAVWVGTREGAARWVDGRFEALPAEHWREPTSAILEPGDGSVWLGSESGRLLHLRPDGSHQTRSVPGRIWQIEDDGQGGVWIAHDLGLAHWVGAQLIPTITGSMIQRLRQLDGTLLLTSEDGLHSFEQGDMQHLAPSLQGSGRERLASVDERGRWINTGASLLLDDEPVLTPRFKITDWLSDEAGDLLVATAGDGLYRISPNAFDLPSGPASLLDAPTYPIVQAPDGAIWIGTLGQGLYRIEPGNDEARRVAEDTAPEVVYSLLPAAGDYGWIGGKGLWRLEAGQAHQRDIPPALHQTSVRMLHLDARQRLWIGTDERGLWLFEQGLWRRQPLPAGLESVKVRVAAEQAGTLWFGTNGYGLLRLSESGTFESLLQERPGRLIRALKFDRAGALLIGTEDQGLCRLGRPVDAIDQTIQCLNRSDGLPADGIHQILPDADGRLWMSSNRGVFSIREADMETAFNGGALAVNHLTEAHGMPDREANGGVHSAGAVDREGRLWFPTMRGPVALDTRRLLKPARPPAAVIKQLASSSGPIPLRDSLVTLPQGERTLEMRFTAPDFSAPEALRFETRLIGLQPDWTAVGQRREVDYTNLQHGHYRFEVRASRSDGRPGPIAAIDLEVPPFIHETTAFKTAISLILLTAVWLLWRWRERSLVRDRQRLAQQVKLRTRELSEAKQAAERSRDQMARQAERLAVLDEEKKSFFASISHELRTPLTLILGPLEAARTDPTVLTKQQPLLYRNARRLNLLVDQIVDLHSIEGGQLRVSPDLHDLVAWSRSISELFEPLANRHRISLRVQAPEAGVLAWFDAGQMEKVLSNLLSNAIKYCRPGDEVTVAVTRKSEQARLEVRDTGPGIASRHQDRLFDRFYRAVPHDSPIEGTGIGLALARELMLLHGGDLRLDSAPGQGARFFLHWPARACDGALEPEPKAMPEASSELGLEPVSETVAGPPGTTTRILIVDDNADLRQWLTHILSERFEVDQASDGQGALQRMAERLPDLIVSDWMMPGMNGLELLETLREHPEFKTLPVIMLSARAKCDDRIQALAAGAVAYLPKPFQAEMLKAQIDALLGLSLRLRAALAAEPIELDQAPGESSWMHRLRKIIAAHLHDPDFGVEALAAQLNIGRTGLFRRIKDETGSSPSALLREARLLRAAELLDMRHGSVSEIAYAVGFCSLDGFTRAFIQRFNQRPSERLARSDNALAATTPPPNRMMHAAASDSQP